MARLSVFEAAGAWFAAQVWAGRERASADHLRCRGYDVLLPEYCEYRRWSDRVKKTDKALFTGYVFCRLNGDVFGKVLTAPYVIRIVGDGEGPLPISDDEIDAIQRLVKAGVQSEPYPYLRMGERVRIAAGPLTGTEGVLLRAKGRHRLVLSISLLQRSVALEVDADWLMTAPAATSYVRAAAS